MSVWIWPAFHPHGLASGIWTYFVRKTSLTLNGCAPAEWIATFLSPRLPTLKFREISNVALIGFCIDIPPTP